MHVSLGPSSHSWHPVMTVESASFDYWWNWRVLVSAIWVLSSMVIASILIWKHEGSRSEGEDGEGRDKPGVVYEDESWGTCIKEIHPAWLLAFRIVAFFVLSALLVVYVIVESGSAFYYYTQWTFTMVTLHFAFGSVLSLYGCYQDLSKVDRDMNIDAERGTYVAPNNEREICGTSNERKNSGSSNKNQARQVARVWGYVFQILYQTNAGAVILTDIVFWLIIVPFLAIQDYDLNLLMIGMHSLNFIFLLGDATLNSMRFPWFRISYFLLWTSIYVIFQWIIHACISIWWPYPILDLSSNYAPLWYLLVALLHVPCYAIFPLLLKLKHLLLSSWFPQSYQPTR